MKHLKSFNEKKGDESQEQTSDAINDVEMESEDGEKLNPKDYEIESIIDFIKPEDIDYGNELVESSITTHVGAEGKDYKRGDIIYISALIRKKGTTSFNSPAKTAVLKCRITDIYFGLQYLKKVINK